MWLSLGLRPEDIVGVSSSHLHGGRLFLDEIVHKTEPSGRPVAPLVVKWLLGVLGGVVSESESDVRWFWSRKKPFRGRDVRTTAAVQLTISGAAPLLIQERLGHETIEMIIRHYVRMRPPDYNNEPAAEYYGERPVRLDGVEVGIGDFLWDRWLLRTAIKVLKGEPAWLRAREMLQSLAGVGKKGQDVAPMDV